jgi:hypothetical protein
VRRLLLGRVEAAEGSEGLEFLSSQIEPLLPV